MSFSHQKLSEIDQDIIAVLKSSSESTKLQNSELLKELRKQQENWLAIIKLESNKSVEVGSEVKRVAEAEPEIKQIFKKTKISSSSDSSSSSGSSSSSASSSSASSSSSTSSGSESSDSDQEPEPSVLKNIVKITPALVKNPANYFTFIDEIVSEDDEANSDPKVIYTEARLYNPDFCYSQNQLKRHRAEKRKNGANGEGAADDFDDVAVDAVVVNDFQSALLTNSHGVEVEAKVFEVEIDDVVEIESDGNKTVEFIDYSSLPTVQQPRKGLLIAFRQMELSSEYTPELSDYRHATITVLKKLGGETIVTLQPVSTVHRRSASAPVDGWSALPKLNTFKTYYGEDEEPCGKFELDLESIEMEEDAVDLTQPFQIEWDALFDVRLVESKDLMF